MAKILIVDDAPEILDIFSQALVRQGYEVVTADNGQMALSVFGGNTFDCVLTDLQMPAMDGTTLIRLIRQLDSTVPLCVILGSAASVEDLANEAPGAQVYLRKPVSLDKLNDVVARLIFTRSPTSALL